MPAAPLSDSLAAEALDAWKLHQNQVAAAASLGISRTTFQNRLRVGLERERTEALKPMGTPGFEAIGVSTSYDAEGEVTATHLRERVASLFEAGGEDAGEARDGFGSYLIKGVSTLFDAEGNQRQQWIKTRIDDARWLAGIKAGLDAWIADHVAPLEPPPPMPGRDSDVIPWINIGDAHIGMLAHEAETGENFDLKIAERELCAAISIAVDEMGEHDRVVIQDMGDATHYENFSATTEASGHPLDFDSRFPRMIKVYSRVMRFIVEKVLEKANTVDVIINQGNHSRTNDIWMAELLRVAYGHTGRVNVLDNDSVFIGYRMGRTFVLCHHSDKCRPARLAHVMATDFPADWGEAEYRYIDIGHIHHNMVLKEHPGVVVESFNQLAAKDKWAAEAGYRSRQCLTIVHRSRTYGEVGRRTLPIQRVRDVIEAAMTREGKAFERAPVRRAFAV